MFIWQFAKIDRSDLQNAKLKIVQLVIAKSAKLRVLLVALELLCYRRERLGTIRESLIRIHNEQGGHALMTKIKVIKKGEAKPAPAAPPVKQVSKKAAAREMVSTVSNWVSDFKKRKHDDETKLTLDAFFTPNPATSRP
jgi:hypothetical protein